MMPKYTKEALTVYGHRGVRSNPLLLKNLSNGDVEASVTCNESKLEGECKPNCVNPPNIPKSLSVF